MASIPYTDKQLTRDQQKLADAASENSKNNSMAQGVAEQAAHLKDNVQFAGGALNTGSKLLRGGKTVYDFGKGGVLLPLTIADYATAAFTEDGSGLYENIGRFGGNLVAKALYGDTSQPPISSQELQAIRDGKNPNKPIMENDYNPLTGYTGKSGVVGYEPMAKKSEAELAQAAQSDSGSQFEGSALMPDGSTKGYLIGGGSKTMTPEEISAFEKIRETGEYTGVPMGKYQNVPDTKGSVQLPLGQDVPMSQDQYVKQFSGLQNAARDSVFRDEEFREKQRTDLQDRYFGQERFQEPAQPTSAPQMDGISDKGAKMLADFERFKRSGQEMTPEMFNKANKLALSVGRTFDPETGYSREFSPEIMEEFNRRVQEGTIDPSSLQISPSQKPAEKSFYEQESERREQRLDEGSSFNQPQMRVRGEMVPATEESRKLRDQEKMFKQQGQEEGLSGSALNAYVDRGFSELEQERIDESQKQEDRATKKIMDNLSISNAQASLLAKKAKMLEVPKLSASQSNAIQKLLASNGVSFDPETGALTTEVKKFMRPDGTINLSPDSAIYKLLEGTEGGEAFLAPPASVQSAAADAEVGQLIQASDGRVYRVLGNGEFQQVL